MKLLTLILSFTLLVACQSEEAPVQGDFEAVAETQGVQLKKEDEAWLGSGRILMASEMRSLRDSLHLAVAGQFLSGESSFVLHLFTDGFDYPTGLQLRFRFIEDEESSENQRGSVDVEFSEPGYSFRHLTTLEDVVSEDGIFRLRVEAIDRYNNSHRILLWNDQQFINSEQVAKRDRVLEKNADYDSFSQDFLFYGWGQGLKWGVELHNMRLNSLKREAPFVDL